MLTKSSTVKKVLNQKSTIQQQKFNDLLKNKKPQHDSEKIIFNYSSYVLSEAEKSLLLKDLNYNIPPKNLIMLVTFLILNYSAEIFVTFRCFHKDKKIFFKEVQKHRGAFK